MSARPAPTHMRYLIGATGTALLLLLLLVMQDRRHG